MVQAFKNFVVKPLGVAALIACLSAPALADKGAPAKLDPAVLAFVDAAIHLCVSVDDVDERQYQQLRKSLIGDRPAVVLRAAQKTAEYKREYSMMNTVLAGASHDWAVRSCKNAIATSDGNNSETGHDDHDKGHDKDHAKDRDGARK
jgi:hypothetical protein